VPYISKSGMAALHTHCWHELFHVCWDTLLDEDFLHAYGHGIVLKCTDGILCRIFLHIFTYSTDYPEKCVLSVMIGKSLTKFQGSNCHY
jgi:hypothetical protein